MTAFDVDVFLQRPLTARLATDGPTVRPVWFLREGGAFWVLTGPWTRLFHRVREHPAVALVVDECAPATGLVRQVIARGRAEPVSFDVPRAAAGSRATWARTKGVGTHGSGATRTTTRRSAARCGCVAPASLHVQDLSYAVAD